MSLILGPGSHFWAVTIYPRQRVPAQIYAKAFSSATITAVKLLKSYRAIFVKASEKADTPPVLLLKHTGTQLLQGVSCLSFSKLILLETTLEILPTWSLWSQNKYLGQFLGASSSFPNAGSGYLSFLEFLIEELYCKVCKGENITSFLLFLFSPCKCYKCVNRFCWK